MLLRCFSNQVIQTRQSVQIDISCGHRQARFLLLPAISLDFKIDGLPMPQLQRDCRTAIQRKFSGHLIELSP